VGGAVGLLAGLLVGTGVRAAVGLLVGLLVGAGVARQSHFPSGSAQGLKAVSLTRGEIIHARVICAVHMVLDWVCARIRCAGVSPDRTSKGWCCFAGCVINSIPGSGTAIVKCALQTKPMSCGVLQNSASCHDSPKQTSKTDLNVASGGTHQLCVSACHPR